jgi:tetratricopeptide (TPR) repeat protein
MHREYHNVTSYFNGYFNANERVKAGVEKITAAYKEDYDQLLPVFIIGDTASARSAYPDMEKAIEKCEKVISRHTITNDSRKDVKKPKLNKWIDDNYMTLGQAHYWKRNYYRSEELFNYVNRKFKEKDEQLFSASWAARSAMERGEYSKALLSLSKIEAEADMDEDLKANYYLVFADLYLRQGKLKDAAEKLELAIRFTKKKKNRARPNFILAQIYQQLERSNEAVERYEMVLRSRPNYELAFYAQINKALAFSRRGGSSDGIKKELEKMIRDEKNKDYLDQIYFALGDIFLEEQKRPEAVAYFDKSLRVTKADNKKQKSKTFLRLADLYFDQRQYANAQLYYDSTFKNLNPEHARFIEVKARAESLGELVGYLNKINLNDSLTQICALKGDALENKLRDIQATLAQEAQEQRRRDEEAAAALAAQQTQSPGAVPATTGAYWIYNPTIRQKGHDDFKDTWGDRPLKDNWRLASKVSQLFDSPDESLLLADSASTAAGNQAEDRYKVPDIEELRASLPCDDPSKMQETSAGVAEAYYQAGLIYKEKLDDEDNAIGSWQQLISNIDTSSFHPVAYYQLFRTWLSKEATPGYKPNPFCSDCSSAYWADEIRSRYPGSEWSRLVDNPEYIDQADMKRTEENAAYESAYQMYVSRRYLDAIGACTQVIDNEPDNQFCCKYRLLRAVCVGYTDAAYSIRENYYKELQEVKKNCGNSEEAKRADDLLKAGNQEVPGSGTAEKPDIDQPNPGNGSDTTGGNPTNPTNPTNTGTGNTSTPPVVDYKLDLNAEHYMVTLLPIQGSDVNRVKAALADFNISFYASAALKVTNNLLGQQYHIVMVKPFKSANEAKEYLSTVKSNQDDLKDVNSANNKLFLISKPNYITLFKSRDVEAYLQFYQANYP